MPDLTFFNGSILFGAAVAAGALNSVAGGGSFISFPTLVFTGVLPIPANATNTVALWPGSAASAGAYRQELSAQRRVLLILGTVSVIGGLTGAVLLLRTPAPTFTRILPWLLLAATLLFATGGRLNAWLRSSAQHRQTIPSAVLIALAVAQLLIAVYGGYFGGGIGMLMLATMSLAGMENIHAMNALKTLLNSCINGAAVVTFALSGVVVWPQALVMVAGAILGGYGGARYARRVNPLWVRRVVILIGIVITIWFFLRK